jgi:hypothetical protein
MDALSRLIHGSIDLHVHPAPSLFPRRIDEVEAARAADEVGMRAIVVKSHHHSTAPDALMLRKYALQNLKTEMFGAVVLNSYAGGLNPYIVDMTLRYGGRIVWFPTLSTAAHIKHATEHFPSQQQGAIPEVPIQLLDPHGELVSKAREVLRLVADSDVAVSPGHASAEEALVILRGAREAGVHRMIVNHPDLIIEATEAQVLEFCRLGAYIEHSLGMYIQARPLERLIRWIEVVGPEKTVLGSDLGQKNMVLPLEAYRTIIGRLLDSGVRESDVEWMIKKNPSWLLKVEA